jgi:hypothetical protein
MRTALVYCRTWQQADKLLVECSMRFRSHADVGVILDTLNAHRVMAR